MSGRFHGRSGCRADATLPRQLALERGSCIGWTARRGFQCYIHSDPHCWLSKGDRELPQALARDRSPIREEEPHRITLSCITSRNPARLAATNSAEGHLKCSRKNLSWSRIGLSFFMALLTQALFIHPRVEGACDSAGTTSASYTILVVSLPPAW